MRSLVSPNVFGCRALSAIVRRIHNAPAAFPRIVSGVNFGPPHDPLRRRIVIGGHSLTYTYEPAISADTCSPSPLVVCIHGLPGSTYDYRYIGPVLSRAGAAVLRIDCPGHSESSRQLTADASGRAMAVALVRTILPALLPAVQHNALPPSRMLLLGHSMGAETVLHCSALLLAGGDGGVALPPLAAVAVINPVGLRPHAGMQPWSFVRRLGPAQDWPYPFGALIRRLVKFAWLRLFGLGARASPGEIEWSQKRASARDMSALARDVAALRAAQLPAAVFFADDDKLVESAVPRELAEALGAAIVVRSKRGGHYLNKAHGTTVAEACVELLGMQGAPLPR